MKKIQYAIYIEESEIPMSKSEEKLLQKKLLEQKKQMKIEKIAKNRKNC